MLRISRTIRRTETIDGGILLDVHHGQMFCLNVVGARILGLLEGGHDETSVAEHISQEYAADPATVRAHVIEFIETLEKHHILEPTQSHNVT